MRETELVVSMPVVNPDTGAKSRTFVFAGKVDGIEGETIDDWKSTDDPHKFVSRRAIAFQAELYLLALQHMGRRGITGIRYRLITKPGLRLSDPKHTYAVMRAKRKTAVRVFDDPAEAESFARAQGCTVEHRCKGDRTLQAYEDRCVEWIQAEPDRLFDHTAPVSTGRLKQAGYYLWECCKRILDSRSNSRWLPNSGACEAYGRECPYLSLCECAAADADPSYIIEQQYEVADNAHPELNGQMSGSGKDVVTQSSIGCLCLCEVRYYWRYERRLRKPRTSIDAAWLGSAMHVGLEHFVVGGLEAAYAAIDEWREHNPVLGEDVRKQNQEIAKARAMTRAAAGRWM